MDLIQRSLALGRTADNPAESVIGTSMDERDIETLLRWPHTNICTDGELAGKYPRGAGAFPRILGRSGSENHARTGG